MLYADGQITKAETKSMEIIGKVLEIDPGRAQAMVAVLAVKNRA